MKRPIFFGTLIILTLSTILVLGRPLSEPSSNITDARHVSDPSAPNKNQINLSFEFEADQKVSYVKNLNPGDTLFDIIKKSGLKIETENFPPLGVMISSIDGFKNGTDGKYWQYWINGQYAQIGASSYKPRSEDTVEWRFTNEKN